MENKFKIKFIITSMIIIITCNGNYDCSGTSGPSYSGGSGCSSGGGDGGTMHYKNFFKIIRVTTDEGKSKFFLISDYDVSITKITVKRNSTVVATINYSYPFLQCKANQEMLIDEYLNVTQGSVWSFVFNGLKNGGGFFENIQTSINIY